MSLLSRGDEGQGGEQYPRSEAVLGGGSERTVGPQYVKSGIGDILLGGGRDPAVLTQYSSRYFMFQKPG